MRILALYDIHGNVDALDAVLMLQSGWPDERSIAAALTDPLGAIVIARIFEDRAGG